MCDFTIPQVAGVTARASLNPFVLKAAMLGNSAFSVIKITCPRGDRTRRTQAALSKLKPA
jgi:hypothetical protein